MNCQNCGTSFEPKRSNQKHCSPACKQAAYNSRKLPVLIPKQNNTVMRTFAEKAVGLGAIELTKAIGRSAGSSIGRNATRSNGGMNDDLGERQKQHFLHFLFTIGGGALGVGAYTWYIHSKQEKQIKEIEWLRKNDAAFAEKYKDKKIEPAAQYVKESTLASAFDYLNDKINYINGGYVDYEWKLSGAMAAGSVGIAIGEVAYQGWRLWVDYIRAKKENIEQLSDAIGTIKVMSAKEMIALQQPTFNLKGKFGDFLGERLNLGFSILIYGIPGSGKSHFATQFASLLAQSGAVLYVLSEEGSSQTVRERVERYGAVDDLFTTESRDWQNIYQYVMAMTDIRFVVIDSLNGLTGNYDQQISIVKALRSVPHLYGSVVISQINKDQTAKAGTGLLHEVDTEIFVHDGIAETRKNRFAPGGNTMSVFPEKQGVLRLSGTDGFSK